MISCMASSEYYNHICDFDNYMDKDNNRVSMDIYHLFMWPLNPKFRFLNQDKK